MLLLNCSFVRSLSFVRSFAFVRSFVRFRSFVRSFAFVRSFVRFCAVFGVHSFVRFSPSFASVLRSLCSLPSFVRCVRFIRSFAAFASFLRSLRSFVHFVLSSLHSFVRFLHFVRFLPLRLRSLPSFASFTSTFVRFVYSAVSATFVRFLLFLRFLGCLGLVLRARSFVRCCLPLSGGLRWLVVFIGVARCRSLSVVRRSSFVSVWAAVVVVLLLGGAGAAAAAVGVICVSCASLFVFGRWCLLVLLSSLLLFIVFVCAIALPSPSCCFCVSGSCVSGAFLRFSGFAFLPSWCRTCQLRPTLCFFFLFAPQRVPALRTQTAADVDRFGALALNSLIARPTPRPSLGRCFRRLCRGSSRS